MKIESLIQKKHEKFLGVTFNSRLNFHHYISNICKTAGNKLHALARVSNYMDQDKKKILFNSYFLSQFNYCTLIWMNHNKSTNNRTNSLHKRALRLIYCDHSSNFQELLKRDNSVTIYQKNIQALAILKYKKWFSVSSAICKYRMEWLGNHFKLRSRNLEYGTRRNETKITFVFFQRRN